MSEGHSISTRDLHTSVIQSVYVATRTGVPGRSISNRSLVYSINASIHCKKYSIGLRTFVNDVTLAPALKRMSKK